MSGFVKCLADVTNYGFAGSTPSPSDSRELGILLGEPANFSCIREPAGSPIAAIFGY